MHGGRFCSLDQTHSECKRTLVETMSFRSRNRVKAKKKRSSPQFGTKFDRNSWNLFVLPGPFLSVQPVLKARWGEAESQWGDTKS